MNEFNPFTASPDAIVEHVNSLSKEKLKEELTGSYLLLKKAERWAIEASESVQKTIEKAIKDADDLVEENTSTISSIEEEMEELRRKKVFSFDINLFGYCLNIHFKKV